ncbi:Uncharacterised protein [Vibrio cholerae]|nr:Uncharacterised protein [Vibrio cholerae]
MSSPPSRVMSSLSCGFSVSGIISFANSRPPGAAMNDAATKYSILTPIEA